MKSKTLKIVFSVLISVIVIICIFLYLYIQYKNKQSKTKLLNLADNIICEDIVNSDIIQGFQEVKVQENDVLKVEEKEVFSVEKIKADNDILGKIKISKIDLEAPIKEGTSQAILKESVGHFSNTSYWNGNVALASHNRGSYAHYFENLNKLEIGDEITYQTKLGTRIYIIDKIEQISEYNLSVLDNTDKNTITLITCITNKPNLRLCVKASEKI